MSDNTRRVYRPRTLYAVMNVLVPGSIFLIGLLVFPDFGKIIWAILGSAGMLMLIGQSLLSRLEVSSEGLEYWYWPYYHVRCRWGDIARQGTERRWGYTQELLYLKQAQALGPQFTLQARKRRGLGEQPIIPLTGFTSESREQLAEYLRQYAPQLYAAR